ncbi:MAG: hypothetical protein JJLCMIEE_02112 [Acidimicrobiales bacterium]|nr:MAG: hypothetical protein EDR02_03355 [Actinomycetota bacterium]MBV6509045.1 hypothetical protein [Acidimicrobiales bacterium]RIK06246.1 MAG: hypothetical protein DCC48_07390 [Acidobacteriota bacterium]
MALGGTAVGLVIASVLLLSVQTGPGLADGVPLAEVLGYQGIVGSLVLALRVINEMIRDGYN